MKRILILALVLALLGASALADDMIVVNCNEWVSLRKAPSTSADRLKKVPLGETVTDCEWTDSDFIRCTWDGETGYIQTKYLEPLETGEAETVLDATLTSVGMNVLAWRQFVDGETLTVTGYASNGSELWSVTTNTPEVTELTATTAFIGGTADAPRVMLYNSNEGLSCLDVESGRVEWMLPIEQCPLGASICHAVDEAGTLFISGYYGPDPVCIDVNGKELWNASVGRNDIYWPYEITLTDRGVETRYEMTPNEGEGTVVYDRTDGHVVSVEFD